MKKSLFVIFAFILAISLSGCLTVEKKIYKIKLKKDGSGTMEILYVNIFSQISEDDSVDQVVSDDFSELLSDYVLGTKLDEDFPDAEIIEKKLFKKNHQLWGKVVYKFDNYKDIKLFKYNENCPYMFKFSGDESYDQSNGEYNEDIKLVIWNGKKKTLKLITKVSEPDSNDVSLLDLWEKSQE